MKKLLILISFLALSCSNDKTSTPPEKTALNLVTGINCIQDPDGVPVQFGNPNVLVNNKFVIFPNPTMDVINISSQENITDIWVVRANPEKIYQNVNFKSILNTNLYSEQSIISHSNFSLSGQSSNSIFFSANLSTLEKGYYRVFVKIGGQIYWDNLYKLDNQGNAEEQTTSIDNFWN